MMNTTCRGRHVLSVAISIFVWLVVGCGGSEAVRPDPTAQFATAVALVEASTAQAGLLATSTPTPNASPTVTPIDVDAPQAGMILFHTETQVDQAARQYDLYAIIDGQVNFVASDTLTQTAGGPTSARFFVSPDLTSVAYSAAGWGTHPIPLYIIGFDATSRAFEMTAYNPGEVVEGEEEWQIDDAAWSPDGTRLAVQTECHIHMLTVATGEIAIIGGRCYPVVIKEGPDNIAWSPDGSMLAFNNLNMTSLPTFLNQLHGGRPTELVLADAGGAWTEVLNEHGGKSMWSPTSDQLIYIGGVTRTGSDVFTNERLYVINADGSGRLELAPSTDESLYGNPAVNSAPMVWGWSANGNQIFLSLQRGSENGFYTIQPDGTDLTRMSGDEYRGARYDPLTQRAIWWEGQPRRGFLTDGSNVEELPGENRDHEFTRCPQILYWEEGELYQVVSTIDVSQTLSLPSKPVLSPGCGSIAFEQRGDVVIADLADERTVLVEGAQGDADALFVDAWILPTDAPYVE